MKNKRKILIISISIVAALAIIFGACAIYLGDYYRADEGAIAVFAPEDNVSVSTIDGGNVVFEPQNATVGFIFYPGGKGRGKCLSALDGGACPRGCSLRTCGNAL